MEELLARSDITIKTWTRGEVVQAKISDISSSAISLDIGGKSEGVITGPYLEEIKSYIKNIKKGDKVSAVVIDPETPEGYVRLSMKHFATEEIWKKLEEADQKDKEVEVIGKAVTSKGIIVDFNNMSGFVPQSQLGDKAASNPDSLVDSSFKVKVLEVDKKSGKIVFSERLVSEKDKIELIKTAQETFKEGEIYDAKITDIANYGIFVELPVKLNGTKVPVEGFVHISELSWDKVEDPHTLFKKGDKIKATFIGIKDDKLTLSIRKAQKDPWETIIEKYPKEKHINGVVVKKSSFGAFVQLEPGVEGLVHITKIPPDNPINKGDEVTVYVEDVDKEDRKISLGLVLTSKPVGYK
jgi:small subunit ribosomal protein S1